jgi:hypothetical protein
MKAKLYLLFLSSFSLLSYSTVRIVCSAALTKDHFEFRKQQYIEAFNIITSLGYKDFYVIEAMHKHGPTFLEEYTSHVFYATVNNPRLKNNGINEAKTMLEGCNYFNFDPEDIIVKLTGRHSLMSNHLLKIVENNPDVDAFVKVNADGNVFTLGFAMRYKYLKEMFETIDYGPLEQGMIPIEYRVGDYVKKKKREGDFKVIYLEKLDIKANVFGSSTAPGVSGIGYH